MTKDDKSSQCEMEKAANLVQANRTGLVLKGRIIDGKVELDESTVKEIAEKFPKADISFVALNSPFDPVSEAVA